MNATTQPDPSRPTEGTPWRQDAGVIGLVGMAHGISHYSQLLLAPLFPWLKDEFAVSYAQLGFLMTVFFVVSCAVQTTAGFMVDRYGPRPILFAGLALIGLAAFGWVMPTARTASRGVWAGPWRLPCWCPSPWHPPGVWRW